MNQTGLWMYFLSRLIFCGKKQTESLQQLNCRSVLYENHDDIYVMLHNTELYICLACELKDIFCQVVCACCIGHDCLIVTCAVALIYVHLLSVMCRLKAVVMCL